MCVCVCMCVSEYKLTHSKPNFFETITVLKPSVEKPDSIPPPHPPCLCKLVNQMVAELSSKLTDTVDPHSAALMQSDPCSTETDTTQRSLFRRNTFSVDSF